MNGETPENDDVFELDKDQLDALRLETESATPTDRENIDRIIHDCYKRFMDKIGTHIERPIPEGEVASKFVPVDKATHIVFNENWVDHKSKTNISYIDIGTSGGTAFPREGHFTEFIPKDLWSELTPDQQKHIDEQAKQRGETSGKDYVNDAVLNNRILHEMMHLNQRKENPAPLWLQECQAYWVAREAMDEDHQIHTPEFDAIADFFQHLLDKFGTDVHGVICNQGFNGFTLYLLEKEFTPEVQQRLFPDYTVKPAEK